MADNSNKLVEKMGELAFDPNLKKKKKSPGASSAPPAVGSQGVQEEAGAPTPDIDEHVLNHKFDPTIRKKKKKTVGIIAPPTAIISVNGDVSVEQAISRIHPGVSAPTEDGFYSYQELLKRAFATMCQQNPKMLTFGERKPFSPKAPSVLRLGTKRTCIANFLEVCDSLKRQLKHVQSFMLAELGTGGSVDNNQCLIIKGKFQQVHIENLLRKYIKEYITCPTCRSHETSLQKQDRLVFLLCEDCHSRRSVASIKTGYQAQIGRRAVRHAITD